LDHYLEFEETKKCNTLVEQIAIELMAKGPSYRHAANTLEKLLFYRVISHETIRKHLLQLKVEASLPLVPKRRVLFIKVDGLYLKRQSFRKKGKRRKLRRFMKDGNKMGNGDCW
jgi:Uncharacterised protein family (UPF0236)